MFVEEQQVGADCESECDPSEGVDVGLCFAGFVAAQEGDVDVGAVGERLLGEVVLLAQWMSRSANVMSAGNGMGGARSIRATMLSRR